MNIRKFFLAGLAILAVSACSNDDKDQTDSVSSELTGYISLSISAPQTKTTQTGNVDPSEGTESDISTVTIVLTNSAGVILEAVRVNMATATQTEAAQVSPGQYYVYALVNYDGGVLTGNILQQVIDVNTVDEATNGYRNGSFLMTNEFDGGVATTHNGGIPITISETANNTPATAATAAISVDRTAVKIVDRTDYTSTAPDVTDLASSNTLVDGVNITGFVLLNVNKQLNIIQAWDVNGVLETPLHTDLSENVSEQYFLNIGEYTSLTKDGTGDITAIQDLTSAADFQMGAANIIYTTENRPAYRVLSNGEYTSGRGETTGVIYRVVAQNAGSDVGTFFKYGTVVSTNWADIAALNSSLPSATPGSADYPSLRAQGVQIYEDGVMYYSHFIKDANPNHQLNGRDYYSVFRNSSYQLTVSKISAIGDDVPGGSVNPVDPDPNVPTDPTDPTDPTNPPIDRENAYIDVTVTINPWILNVINIEF